MRSQGQIRGKNRGVALVAVLWIIIALIAVILVHSRAMTVESMAAKQNISIAQCSAAEMGVEQFMLSAIDAETLTPGYIDALNLEARPLGDCYFWIMAVNPVDESTPRFAISTETSKLDLNTATYDQLMLLPGMTDEFAAAIIDWRQPDDGSSGEIAAAAAGAPSGTTGAEDQYYMSLPVPYHCKNAPFESVDELKLVKGATPEILFGADANHNDTIEAEEAAAANQGSAFDLTMRGILSYVTVFGVRGSATLPAASQDSTDITSTATTAAATQPVSVNPAAAAAATGGRRGGGGAATGNQALQTLLQQYLPDRASAIMALTNSQVAQGTFTSVFNWAVRAQVSSDELTQIYPYITATTQPAATQAAATVTTGGVATTAASQPALTSKIDANFASEVVLMSIGISQTEAEDIISQRANILTDPTQKANIAWILDFIDPSEFQTTTDQNGDTIPDVGEFLTGSSLVYSADIVTVTKDGRAFKRVRVVIDTTTGVAQIIYRRDMTAGGWPLDSALRDSLRTGQGLISTGGNDSSKNNGLSLGLH